MLKSTYSRVAAVRFRMVLFSLIASGIFGGIAMAWGNAAPVLIVVAITGLFCSLLCAGICQRLVAEIFSDQLHVIRANELRQRQRRESLEQIFALQGRLELMLQNLLAGEEKETTRVREAVGAMERLDRSFSVIMGDIDGLSGHTEERASISTQMGATTDAIAENINQYSRFVTETSSSIEEMTRTTRETAENIRALSISTEQTVSSINTISSSQNTVRDNSERSVSASKSVRTQAQQGLFSMNATMKAMQEIARSSDESFDSINRLSRHSARVGEFLSVIQEVVQQTNLLSLNASIIAAQAGTRGRAFAVVAEEVRSLARRTSASTKEIEELVRNIQKETSYVQRSVTQGKDKVKEGVKISALANEALVAIDKSAEDAYKMVSTIAVETTDQAANIQRITEEAEKNLDRVQQLTLATECQQQGSIQILNNLEQMRELDHRINSSAQEQVRGNRLYLKSVMEDNERTRELKNEAVQYLSPAKAAIEAVKGVAAQLAANTDDIHTIEETLESLKGMIARYSDETDTESDYGSVTSV